MIIQELSELQSQGEIDAAVDPHQEANILLALVNGLSIDSLIQTKPLVSKQQQAVLERYIYELRS